GVRRTDLTADLHPVAVGQADVEDGDVGAGGRDAPQSLLGRAGFADDLHVVLRVQHVAQSAPDDLMVIEEEHPERHAPIVAEFRARDPEWTSSILVGVSEVAGPRALRRLIDAVLTIGSGLDLPSMLHRIVEAAVDLVDARYGALGVLDESKTRLTQFITVGIDDDVHRSIGPLPEGRGILGTLIIDAEPL